MNKVYIVISVASDGFYSAYCKDCPALFGGGDTPAAAVEELRETLSLTKEAGRGTAAFYPDWLDEEYEFVTCWNVPDLMAYYSGIITPTALGRLANIHPKQVWAYMHGISRPRKAQVAKMETALHKLGRELINTTFL